MSKQNSNKRILSKDGYLDNEFKFVSDMPHIKVICSSNKHTEVTNRKHAILTKIILNHLKNE